MISPAAGSRFVSGFPGNSIAPTGAPPPAATPTGLGHPGSNNAGLPPLDAPRLGGMIMTQQQSGPAEHSLLGLPQGEGSPGQRPGPVPPTRPSDVRRGGVDALRAARTRARARRAVCPSTALPLPDGCPSLDHPPAGAVAAGSAAMLSNLQSLIDRRRELRRRLAQLQKDAGALDADEDEWADKVCCFAPWGGGERRGDAGVGLGCGRGGVWGVDG